MILALILFSTVMTSIITAIELYIDYKTDIADIRDRFDFIGKSYLPTIVESVWEADDMQIETELDGLSNLQDIESISIAVNGNVRWSVGEVKASRTIVREIPIVREYRDKNLNIGTIQIVASVDNVLSRLWNKLVSILISNGVKTLLVSIFMLLIFQLMVGRHLEYIALYVRSLGKRPLDKTRLILERKDNGLWRPDALDYVSKAINGMQEDIAEFQSRVVELNSSLESRVAERTAQLEEANGQLSKALKELEEVSNAKTMFLSRMSHELRTPLNAICGFSELLLTEPLNADQKESLDWINRAGKHLTSLINDLLDMSRIEVGKLSVEPRPENLGAIIDEAIELTQAQCEYRGITLKQLCSGTPTVFVDPTRLKQIIVNLLSNAIKYNRINGSIIIDCSRTGDGRIRLRVEDTGYGIPLEKQAMVFQPFERLGAEYSGIEGTGTGLALSKSLAELMSAHLDFSSTPNKGSIFWIDMPGSAETVESITLELPVTANHGETIRVLYVEDNLANLKLVENIFKHHGEYSVLTAMDGKEALDLARRERPDVILLDIHLPMMDGYQVLGELKADSRMRAIPVIALTADAMPADMQKGLQAGFYCYITKPIDQQELFSALASAVQDLA